MTFEQQHVLKFVVMPLLSAQLLLLVLVYFTLVRKHITAYYQWYVCFICTVIFFLVGRACEYFLDAQHASLLLYARQALLFAVGIPSLVIASAIYTGLRKSNRLYGIPYFTGAVFAIVYILLIEAHRQHFFSVDTANVIQQAALGLTHQTVQLAAICVMLVLPCCYFLIRAIANGNNTKDFVVIFGALLFGLLFPLASGLGNIHWVYYVGSFVPALCWAWVVFKDINEMSGKVNLVKEELYRKVHSGQRMADQDADSLLAEIENLSSHNLNIYKLRLREVLSRLTDNSITAGADSVALLARHDAHGKAIDAVESVEQLRQVARTEVVELSNIVSDIPKQRIERVKDYIESRYQEDIDVEQLASLVNVSRSYLMREFKKLTGTTVNQYLTEHRIDVAKELLKSNSVTDTAFAVGFNNSNYFSTVFKKHTGDSPAKFQQSLQGDGSSE